MNVELTTGSNAYSANQVAGDAMTVGDLLELLEDLAETHGVDCPVVVRGAGSGAVYEPVQGVEESEEEAEDF